MKKLFLFLILAILYINCHHSTVEIIVPPPPPVVKKYNVTVSYGPNGTVSPIGVIPVDSGKNLNLILTPNTGFKPDSITITTTSGKTSSPVSTTYGLPNVVSDCKVQVTFKKDLVWLLAQGPWKYKSDEIWGSSNNLLFSWNITAEQLTDLFYLNTDGTWRVTHSNGVEYGGGNWSLSDITMELIIGDDHSLLIVLDDTHLEYDQNIIYAGVPAIRKEIFWR